MKQLLALIDRPSPRSSSSHLGAGAAAAQTYPSQPIKIIVATAAGGIADLAARTLAQKLGESGKTALVENRTGGAGAIAAEAVAKAPPDGYTLFVGMHSTNAILQHMVAKLSYDGIKDFAPITNVARLGQHPGGPSGRAGDARCASSSPMPRPIPASSPTPRKATAPPGTSWASNSSPHRRRAVQADHRHRHRARALSRRRTGRAGSRRRPCIAHVRHRAAGARPTHRRQGARARGRFPCSGCRPCRTCRPWRKPASPSSTVALVRPARARRHPARRSIDWLNGETRKAFSAPDVHERFVAQGMTLPLGTPEEFGAFMASETSALGRDRAQGQHQDRWINPSSHRSP